MCRMCVVPWWSRQAKTSCFRPPPPPPPPRSVRPLPGIPGPGVGDARGCSAPDRPARASSLRQKRQVTRAWRAQHSSRAAPGAPAPREGRESRSCGPEVLGWRGEHTLPCEPIQAARGGGYLCEFRAGGREGPKTFGFQQDVVVCSKIWWFAASTAPPPTERRGPQHHRPQCIWYI